MQRFPFTICFISEDLKKHKTKMLKGVIYYEKKYKKEYNFGFNFMYGNFRGVIGGFGGRGHTDTYILSDSGRGNADRNSCNHS